LHTSAGLACLSFFNSLAILTILEVLACLAILVILVILNSYLAILSFAALNLDMDGLQIEEAVVLFFFLLYLLRLGVVLD